MLLNDFINVIKNEVVNEKYLSYKFLDNNTSIFFKVLQVSSINKKYGIIYTYSFLLFSIIRPLFVFFNFFNFKYDNNSINNILLFNTSNVPNEVLGRLSNCMGENVNPIDTKSIPKFFFNHLPLYKCIIHMFMFYCLYFTFLINFRRHKLPLFFCYDLLDIYCFYHLVIYANNLNITVGTDDHLQRYFYIISHFANKNFLLQHGYVDPPSDIFYDCKIDNLFLYNFKFKEDFNSYIKNIVDFHILNYSLDLDFISSEKILLIVSSYPFINYELDFVENLPRDYINHKIAVKLHPHHLYDARAAKLISYADFLIESGNLPFCDVVVSYHSFLNEHYENSGINSIYLSELHSDF